MTVFGIPIVTGVFFLYSLRVFGVNLLELAYELENRKSSLLLILI